VKDLNLRSESQPGERRLPYSDEVSQSHRSGSQPDDEDLPYSDEDALQ
jgi:hypothetical protein